MRNQLKLRDAQRKRRKFRVRKNIKGTSIKPRLTIFRSNRNIEVQLIDDIKGETLLGLSSLSKEWKTQKAPKKSLARAMGKKLAAKAKELKISVAVFDRGFYKYHGVLQEFAEGVREGGVQL